jgi:hypothetical protein
MKMRGIGWRGNRALRLTAKLDKKKGLSHSRTYLHTLSPRNCESQCIVDLKSGYNPYAFDVEVVQFANFEQLRTSGDNDPCADLGSLVA